MNQLIIIGSDKVRPNYTESIAEWDYYWGNLQTAVVEGSQAYTDLKDKEFLTLNESEDLIATIEDLQTAIEIIEGIWDFDLSFGNRTSPKGCAITVNDQSRTSSGGNRLRVYYDDENNGIYWLLSEKLQNQMYLIGASGIGMKTALINVLSSQALYRAESGDNIIEIYKEDGTRKTNKEIESAGTTLAASWVSSAFGKFSEMVGKSPAFNLIGRTSNGTEFQRSYTFHFVDAGLETFDSEYDYWVIDGSVEIWE